MSTEDPGKIEALSCLHDSVNIRRLSVAYESSTSRTSTGRSPQKLYGVKFSFFDDFIKKNGGRLFFRGKTTADINSKIITSMCEKNNKQSVCEQLVKQSSPFVGKPTWFISHAWTYQFLDVVDAVGQTLKDAEGEKLYRDTIVWFDQFSTLQPAPPLVSYEVLYDTFMSSTKQIGRMIIVFDKWNEPSHLTRAWCVFELYACLVTESDLRVAMTVEESNNFLSDMRGGYTKFQNMHINSKDSDAREQRDREQIHRAIQVEVPGGFDALDLAILDKLQIWMARLLKRKLYECTVSGDYLETAEWQFVLGNFYTQLKSFGDLRGESEKLLTEALATRRWLLGDEDVTTLLSINNLAGLYVAQGKYEQAEQLYLEAVNGRRRVCGDTHTSTLVSINDLARLDAMQGRYERAEHRFLEVWNSRRATLGDSNSSTLATMASLGNVRMNLGKYDLAEKLFSEALMGMRQILPEKHDNILSTLGGLAELYFRQALFAKAEPYYQEILSIVRHGRKDSDLNVQNAINKLADVYFSQKKYKQASTLYEETLKEAHLEDSRNLSCINNLGKSYHELGEFVLAERWYQLALKYIRRYCGENHPYTMKAVVSLVEIYKLQQKYEQAVQLYVEALNIRLVDTDESTLVSINDLASIYVQLGKFGDAETLYFDALSSRVSEDNFNIISIIDGFTSLCESQKKYEQAEIWYYEAWKSRKQKLGENDPATLNSLRNLNRVRKLQQSS